MRCAYRALILALVLGAFLLPWPGKAWAAGETETPEAAEATEEELEHAEEEIPDEPEKPEPPEREHTRSRFQLYDKLIHGNVSASSVEIDQEYSGNVLFQIKCHRLEATNLTELSKLLEAGAKGEPMPPLLDPKAADSSSTLALKNDEGPGSNRWMAIIRVGGKIRYASDGTREVDSAAGPQFFGGRFSNSVVNARQDFSNNRIVLIDCEELAPGLEFEQSPTPEEIRLIELKLTAIETLGSLTAQVKRPARVPEKEGEKIEAAPANSDQSVFHLFLSRTANWAGGVFGESALETSALGPDTKILEDWDKQLLDESFDRSVSDGTQVDVFLNHVANWQYLISSATSPTLVAQSLFLPPDLLPAGHALEGSLKNGGVFLGHWIGELVDETIDGALLDRASAKIHFRDTANWLLAFSAEELLNNSLENGSALISDWKGELIDEAVDGAVSSGAKSSILLERTANWRLVLSGSQLLNESLISGSSLITDWSGELIDESIDGGLQGKSAVTNRMTDTANWQMHLKGKEILCRSLQGLSNSSNATTSLITNWNGELVDEILDGDIAEGGNATVALKNAANFDLAIDGEIVLEKALLGNACGFHHWEGELADEIIDGNIDHSSLTLDLSGVGNWRFLIRGKHALASALAGGPATEAPAAFIRRWEGELLDELLDGNSTNGAQTRMALRNTGNFDLHIQAEESFAEAFQGNAALISDWEGELIDEIIDGDTIDSSTELTIEQSANWNLRVQGKHAFAGAFRNPGNHLVGIWRGELMDELLDGNIASTGTQSPAKVSIVKKQSANWHLEILATEAGFEEAFPAGVDGNSLLGSWAGQLVDETLDGRIHDVPDLFLGSYDSGNWELRLQLGETQDLPSHLLRDHILGEWHGELIDELIDGESAADTPADDGIVNSSATIENVRSGNWILALQTTGRLDLDADFLAHPFGKKWTGTLIGDMIFGSIQNSKIQMKDSYCGNFIIRAECGTLAIAEPKNHEPAHP